MKIHYFNPGHENAVHNGSPYYTAPANVAAMQSELAYLPAWYGNPDDKVLVNDHDEYYLYLREKLSLPQPIIKNDLVEYPNAEISLWGISPQAIHHFSEMDLEDNINLDIPQWHNEYSYLNSRQNAKDCLIKIIREIPQIQESIIPQFYTELEDVNSAVNNSAHRLLAKAPYSSSGRGLLWLPQTGLTQTENQILHGILKKQESVSIERVLEKDTDFAMEFLTDGLGNIEFAGYSLFTTNNKGAYESNYIGSQSNIEKKLSKISHNLLNDVKLVLTNILKEKYAYIYKGCIGVDMMIYKDNSAYHLHPCVEINMRYNMGFLTAKLYEKFIHPDSQGQFSIDFSPEKGKTFHNHITMLQDYPPHFENGKIISGYLSLCPVNKESRYRAYLHIA